MSYDILFFIKLFLCLYVAFVSFLFFKIELDCSAYET